MRLLRLLAGVVALFGLGAGMGACSSSDSAAGAAAAPPTATPAAAASAVSASRSRNPGAYQYTLAHGGRVVGDPQTGSFYVASATPARPSTLVVTLHGHNGTAFAQFKGWQPYAATHGLGLVAVEWQTQWGANAQFLDSSSTYGLVRRAVGREGTRPGRVLLHGFSQGGHEAFDLTSLDRSGARLFALTIAESGGVHEGPARDPALAGTKWVIYCAGRDPWPQLTGCPAMRRARSYLRASGATVGRFMVDPPAGHGGFLKNRADVELALGDFAAALRR
jgi:predicted esterase